MTVTTAPNTARAGLTDRSETEDPTGPTPRATSVASSPAR